jgi:hypothetical protein
MPGKIMTAKKATDKYPRKTKDTKKGVKLKNSTGKEVTVKDSSLVYHRGKGKFAKYSRKRDLKRNAKNKGQISKKSRNYGIGTGKYRHTSDGKTSSGTKQKKLNSGKGKGKSKNKK